MENGEGVKLSKLEFDALTLEEISFGDRTPTKTQIVNALDGVHKFLVHMGSALLLANEYSLTDQAIAVLFNASIQLRAAKDAFEGGPTSAGLAVPQPGTRVPQNIR